MTLRTRLALGAAGLVAGASGVLLLISWWLVARHLHRTLPAATADAASAGLGREYLLALAGTALLATGGGWLLADRALAPLRRVAATARAISALRLDARVGTAGPPGDELQDVAVAVDGMLERVQAGMDAQRRFAANAGHELRTPLTAIRAEAEVALDDPHADLRATLREIVAATEDSEQLVESLLALAAGQHGPRTEKPVDLAGLVGGGGAAVVVHGDPALLQRAAANLMDNAARHGDGRVAAEATVRADGRAVLRVENGGAPLSPADVARLGAPFERLGRTRASGTGLGLSIVRAIAETHGGRLELRPRAGGGLVAELVLGVTRH